MLEAYFPALFLSGEIANLFLESGPVAKFVLIILLFFSLLSWAIILAKWSRFGRARVQSGRFVKAFRKAGRLQEISPIADQFRPSPLVPVFENGYEEYRRQMSVSDIPSSIALQR